MARPLRLESEGGIYHVLNRGNYRSDLFRGAKTRAAFLKCLGWLAEQGTPANILAHSQAVANAAYWVALPAPSPVYQNKTEIHLKPQKSPEKPVETDNSMFYWYHVALKLVQNITKVMLKPHKTLREYGKEANPALGPVGKYFMELTYLIEKRLYGKRQPDINDVQKSQELALEIQKQAGREQ